MEVLNHALLIGNGAPVSHRLLQQLAREADYIAVADAGAEQALSAKIVPDTVIGDLDSLSAKTYEQLAKRCVPMEKVDNQNNTDLAKALDFLCKRRCRRVTLAGFIGGRVDFSLGNLLALYPYAKKLELCVAADNWRIYPVYHQRAFTARLGARVSLLPLTACYGVTLQGLQYPLKQARLSLGTTRTLSNVATATRFTVSLTRGVLLVYVEI